jgi:hypothetical protein
MLKFRKLREKHNDVFSTALTSSLASFWLLIIALMRMLLHHPRATKNKISIER